jgi:D-glycero-alpha-D-manno-heptose-7-phosphate kinase
MSPLWSIEVNALTIKRCLLQITLGSGFRLRSESGTQSHQVSKEESRMNTAAQFQTARSRAPLRLGLAGGGTDVSPYCDQFGGAVLNVTIDLYAHTTVSGSGDGRIHFIAADQRIEESFDLTTEITATNLLALHRGVYNRVVREFLHGEPLAVTITTYSDAPAGSGLGTSSTVVVSMVQAVSEYLNIPMGEYDVARLAYEIERLDLGLHGGKQDQYAATFGGFNFMEFRDTSDVLVNPLRVKDWIASEFESSLILYFTGRSRSSAAIIEEESRNVRESNMDAINAMHQTKLEAFRMKEALLRGEISKMGEVMRSAWAAKKRMASSISNPMIDELYTLACKEGAYCGKVSGAGGGGFMMFLADPSRRRQVIDALDAYGDGKIMPCHFTYSGVQSWKVKEMVQA